MFMFFCIRLKKFLFCLAGILVLIMGGTVLTTKGFEQAAVAADADTDMSDTVKAAGKEIFVPSVMYHSLLKDPDRAGDYVVSPAVFEEDMRYLAEKGYETVFASDLIDFVEKGVPLPEKPVLVTFDDGYLNVMTYAYPYMKENGLKGVMNVVGTYTDLSTEQDEHNPAYSSLTWQEIAEISQSGVFEIGNHTYNMHSMTSRKGCKRIYGESYEEYRKSMFDDIAMLQGLLSDKSRVTPVTFAYPFGFISEDSVGILQDIGFKALLTCNEKPNYISRGDTECLLSINRYNRPAGISTEEFMEKLLKH